MLRALSFQCRLILNSLRSGDLSLANFRIACEWRRKLPLDAFSGYHSNSKRMKPGGKTMKLLLVAMSLMISAVLLGAAAGNPTVTYVDHGKVAKGGTLVTAPDLSVSINKRTGPGQVEVHDKETERSGAVTSVPPFATLP